MAVVRQVGRDHSHQTRNGDRTWARCGREVRAEVMEREMSGRHKSLRDSVRGRRWSEGG